MVASAPCRPPRAPQTPKPPGLGGPRRLTAATNKQPGGSSPCDVSASASQDPRPSFGSGSRGFRSTSPRDAQAARQREARQEILRKREQVEAEKEQQLTEEEEQLRHPLRPEQVVQQCLALLRKGDTDRLVDLCNPDTLVGIQQPVKLGSKYVTEANLLGSCSGLMDAAARRVLPGHLLRRCQVLSVLRPSDAAYACRVAITGCTGEEVVLDWLLGRNESGLWRVMSIALDPRSLQIDDKQTYHPHPRLPPEAVVLSQVDSLQRGDVAAADAFVARCPDAAGHWFDGGVGAALGRAFRAENSSVDLGTAALPRQRRFLQEVVLSTKVSTEGLVQELQTSFIWGLSVQSNGCWMVDSITSGDAQDG